jgi:phospholipase/lecithinase/hemolysin
MRNCTSYLLASSLLLVPPAAIRAGEPGPIGVLGDSYSDEYQFYPPDRSTARNWVEILAATRGLDFGSFSSVGRGEPRNQGYANNWARSDATTDDLIATGQHTGLAGQIARGEVRLAVIFIGGNDFINALQRTDPLAALHETLPRAIANYRTAFRAVRDARPAGWIVLTTLPDIRHLPEFSGPIRDGRIAGETADAFSRAIRRFNAEIRSLAEGDRRVAVLDLERVAMLADLVSRDFVYFGGRKLDRRQPANDPGHFFLADVRHPGTPGQGIMARLFVELVNARFGAGIEPLDEREILAFAGGLPGSAPRDAGVVVAGLEGPEPGEVRSTRVIAGR